MLRNDLQGEVFFSCLTGISNPGRGCSRTSLNYPVQIFFESFYIVNLCIPLCFFCLFFDNFPRLLFVFCVLIVLLNYSLFNIWLLAFDCRRHEARQ